MTHGNNINTPKHLCAKYTERCFGWAIIIFHINITEQPKTSLKSTKITLVIAQPHLPNRGHVVHETQEKQ